MSAEISVYRHPDEFPADVTELFAAAEREGVSLGAHWFGNYLATIAPSGDGVRFHVLRHDGRAVAALPLLSRRSAWPLHRAVESLGNFYTALYAPALDPALSATALVPLLRAVMRAHRPMGSLRLQPMDPHAPGYRVLLEALRLAGLLPFEFYCFGNWYLRGHGDWATYLAQRNSKMRSNIKRMDKKLAQDGGHVEILADPADCARAVDAYQRVYAASWKREEPFAGFMPGLIGTAAARGWLRLGVAWLNGQPIAAQVWIVAHGKADIYKVAYDETFKDYSPGTVVTARLMQHVMEHDGVSEVDYLIGDDPYKKNWMSHRRERWGVIAYNPRTLAGAVGAAREAVGRTVKPAWQRLKALRPPRPAT